MPLTVSRENRREFTVIAIIGEVDRNGVPRLGEYIDEAFRRKTPQLIFDLSRMSFIDSSGLRVLVQAGAKAAKCGGSCALCCLCPTPRRILNLTGIDAAFDIYPSLDAAMAGGPLESRASLTFS
ncbi:anti-sigma factor antagonist [Sphaerisporangium album]|uniref:Anti-sigma factor antagonist n=1 Tax=Sphaerisporangium album TaxID=509200 RepID=A0A367F2I6_9ACTN|nr:STAS domain-containing protein [Sphaerisporangium album]RCG23995.1 anti-sigma factor antagonist [Sphaerisporangium album]